MRGHRSVLQVLQPEDGGVAEHVLNLSLGLRDRGWRVEVATGEDSAIRAGLARAGVRVHPLGLERRPGAGDIRAALALRALDRTGGYDVVHAHSSKAGALVRFCLPDPARLVYSPHCFSFLAGFSPLQRGAYRMVEQALIRRCAAVVAVCDWERREAARNLRGASSRLSVIYNGVPDCRDAQPDSELNVFKGNLPLAGLVSVLRPQKDPLGLVRAMRVLLDDGAPPAKLAIVGNGPLEALVRAEIERLELDEFVRWFPYSQEVWSYLQAFDLFVLASRWEALPLSVLEAMSCGLPVIATRVGGIPEIVEDGVTGRLVAAGAPDELAHALRGLVADARIRRDMGAAGRARARQRFGVDRMVDETEALYQSVLSRR